VGFAFYIAIFIRQICISVVIDIISLVVSGNISDSALIFEPTINSWWRFISKIWNFGPKTKQEVEGKISILAGLTVEKFALDAVYCVVFYIFVMAFVFGFDIQFPVFMYFIILHDRFGL